MKNVIHYLNMKLPHGGELQFAPTTIHCYAIHNLNIKSRRGELNSPYHDTDKFILSQNHPFAISLNKTFFHILEIRILPKKGRMQFAPTSIVKQYITRQYVSCKLKNVIHNLNIKLSRGG